MDNPDNLKIFIGHIIHCVEPFALNVLEDGFLAVKGNKIIGIGSLESLEAFKADFDLQGAQEIILRKTEILIPGLVDTHIHAPQYPNAGLGYDKPLLEWLDAYTYKLEKKYDDDDFSKCVYDAIVKKTLSHGTTTACYFASLYTNSSLILVDSAIEHGQRALVGKVNMTRFAPDGYVETHEETLRNTRRFVVDVLDKKSELVKPIITPRFALNLEMDVMKDISIIAKEFNLHIQTHISENKSEVQLVNKTFSNDYAAIYDEADLLTPKTVLAHGVYLNDNDVKLLAERGSSIAHCPQSNTLLQSGLCDVRRLLESGLKVGLGTDVAGGASASIVCAMRAALETSIHISFNRESYKPLNYCDAFYLATLGGAAALSMEDKIGNFELGKDFDALVVDMDVKGSSSDYLQDCTPEELLQKFIFLGDDRNIRSVYVSGKLVNKSPY